MAKDKAKPVAEPDSKVETKPEVTTAAKEDPIRVGKDAIYARLGDVIKEMTGKRVGLSGGRLIFDQVVEEIFSEATKEGSFRFNAGFGSLHVKTYGAGTRRLPNGEETTFGERQKVRYEEGVVVSGLVQHKGDLSKVKADRAGVVSTATSTSTAEVSTDSEDVELD